MMNIIDLDNEDEVAAEDARIAALAIARIDDVLADPMGDETEGYLFTFAIRHGDEMGPEETVLLMSGLSPFAVANDLVHWCAAKGATGTLHIITGDDTSRRYAAIDGEGWSLRP